jgi:hypothetical protein
MHCIYRGSKRHTCCESPDLHICLLLKVDCVESQYDKAKLASMVATPEAQDVACCETCLKRSIGNAAD